MSIAVTRALRSGVLAALATTAALLGLAVLPAAANAAGTGTALVTGRVLDGTGAPVSASIHVLVDEDGGLRPYGPGVATDHGAYTVTAPAEAEVAVLVQLAGGPAYWVGGGGVSSPHEFLFLGADEHRYVADVAVGGGRLSATSSPRVLGVHAVGHLLAATRGTWNLAPSAYRYQWLRNGVRIPGATGATYRLTRYDVARSVSVVVVAGRTGFFSGAALSSRVPVRAH